MRTGAEYLSALNDGRRVFIKGEQLANVAEHPLTRGYAGKIAEFYDLHHREEYQQVLTFVDDSGIRRPMMWRIPRSKEELVGRRRYHETLFRLFNAGQWGRFPDVNNSIFLTYIDDPDPWESQSVGCEGRGLAKNIVNFWNLLTENDFNVAPAVIDPPVDRSRESAEAESPNCRVVERNDDGIVIRGVKAVATGSVFADWIMVGVFWRPGMPPEQVMYLVIRANTPGVTIVSRESLVKSDVDDHPLASQGDELDNMIIFEDVFVPWDQVFHLGNPEHAFYYPQRLFDWIHHFDLTRFTVKAELMAGLAILISDSSGLLKIPAVELRVADILRFREAVRAHLIAAEDTGFFTPHGTYKANNLMYDFGRAFYHENAPHIIHELLDLSGRSAVILPSESDWTIPEFQKWLDPMMKGAWEDGHDRIKLFRVVRDLLLSDWSGRNRMFDQFNGTPITKIKMLTMHRAEFQPDGPLTALAREICGIDMLEGQKTTAQEAAEYARVQDAKTV